MGDIDVLVAGAGPVGLTAAIELRRRGIACRIVDQMLEPPQYAKAVGVQPRTLEIFEGMGVLRQVLDEAVEFGGQIVYVDGQEVSRLELPSLPDIPFGFIGIPQYETERILRERLAGLGTQIERDVRLVGFEQDDEGVTATLEGPGRRGDRARRIPGRRRRCAQRRPQDPGAQLRGWGVRRAVHARRRRGRLVASRPDSLSARRTPWRTARSTASSRSR